jgi:predicted RNase H-like HicB family nuclease
MASTQDLYNKLKKDPLVNIAIDYDTFVQRLEDPDFLDTVDEILFSNGDNISKYNLRKKKKRGEDESSQPTEQPSETTNQTPTDGVEPEGRPQKGEPGYNREIGPDEAFISQGWIDRGTWWEHPGDGTKASRQVIYKPIKEEEEQVQTPATDLEQQPQQPEQIGQPERPKTPEVDFQGQPERPKTPEVDFQGQPERRETPTTDFQGQPERVVVPENSVQNVISQQEPDPVKSNKIVTDANVISGNKFKRKKKTTDANRAVIAYTPSSASDKVFVYENGKVRSMDKRSDDYSKIISSNPYTVQLQNSDAFKDLIQLQREGNKQGFQNYLETAGNPAAREIADRSFGELTQDDIIESTMLKESTISAEDSKNRKIPFPDIVLGKLKNSNLYHTAEGLWNNIINKEVDRPWQKEEVYDAEDFINNVDPSLTDEEKQSQQAFDTAFESNVERPTTKQPRRLSKPLYVNTIDENLLYTNLEEKRKGFDFIKINPKTGTYEFSNAKDVNDFYEIEGNRVGRKMAESFMKEWDASPEQSDFRKNPYNQYKYQVYKDYKNWPINGSGSNLEFSLETIKNKESEADFEDLHENGYKDAYSTQIRSPYDVQSEIDNIKKILDGQPNMPYQERQNLYNQWAALNDSLLFIYEQNIQDYATYLRNKGHEKEAADMLSTYDYYKRKTGGFQTMPVSELDDADKRVIMNLRNQAVNNTMRYLQSKYQTLSNTVDIITYQKLAQKPMQVVASQFEILKSIGALDENGNINPSAKIKQSDQVKLSDAVLKINLAKDQIASAAESTGATPENLNELKRLGEKLGNLQNVEFSFYQNYAMNDLKEEDENEKRNQKIAEDRMKSDDFFTSFFYTALYGGSNVFVSGLSTLAKLGKVPDNIADALGDETQLFDTWSAHVDELIKDMNGYQPQDMEGFSGMQKFWMNTTAGIGNLGAMALTGFVGGPLLTGLTMLSDQVDNAKANGMDDDEAAQWGLLTSYVLGKINQIVPDSKSFYDGLKPSMKNILKEFAKGKITYQEATRMFNRTLLPSLEKHFKQIGGETAEEMLEEFTTQLMGMGANLTWDNASFNKNFDPNSIIGAGESAASLTAFLAPFKKGRKWNVIEQDALLSLVQNKETVLKNITFDSKEELDEITKQLTELENLETGLQSMPGYMELSNEKKSKVLTDLYIAKAMELAAKNRGLGKNDPGFIEAEKIREDVLNSLKTPEKGEVPTQTESQKPETNAVQEPSTTEVLPSQQGEVRETGRKRQGVEPGIQGEEVTQEGGKKEIVPGAKDIVSEVPIQYPTEQEMQERKEFRSTPEYIQSTSDRIDDVNLDEVKSDLEGDFGLLTAENPMAQPLTEEENAQLNKKAEQWLTDKGYSFKKVTGKYGQGENSFLVPKLTKEDALAFAKQFNQDSVAHSDGLIYQDGTMNPRVKEDDDFSFKNEYNPDSDFVSVVKSDGSLKTFSVGYNFDVKENAFESETKAQEERKSAADKIRGLKSEGGRAYSAALGIPIAIWDGAIETIATAIEAGQSIVNAINKGKEYLKEKLGSEYDESLVEDELNKVISSTDYQAKIDAAVKPVAPAVPLNETPEFQKRQFNTDNVKTISAIDLDGKQVVMTGSDRMTTAEITLPNGVKVNAMGGIYYPLLTGKVWAATGMKNAGPLAKAINESLQKQIDAGVENPEVWFIPINNAEGGQSSNYSFTKAALESMHQAFMSNDIKKEDILKVINSLKNNNPYKWWGLKDADNKKLDKLKAQLKKAKNEIDREEIEEAIAELEKKSYVPKMGSLTSKSTKAEIIEAIETDLNTDNATYSQRKKIIASIIGDKRANFKGVPSVSELQMYTAEPTTVGVDAITATVAVRITKPVTARLTSSDTDGGDFHNSYPAVVEPTEGGMELYQLDGSYKMEDIVPEVTISTGPVKFSELSDEGYSSARVQYKDKALGTQGATARSAAIRIASSLRSIANEVRAGRRGGLGSLPIDPILTTIAAALDAGASLTEAIAKGIEAFKNSDLYKNLTIQEKSKAVNDLKRAMDEQIAPTIANLINEEMLKGKGVYTASQNVKNQMIKEGVIDEATFDRIVGKAEKLVKEDAEMMFNVAVEDAKEAIKAGKTVDEAVAILNDAVNKQIGFYSNLDKSIKKDMVAKAQAKMMSEVAGELAGAAKSLVDTQGILKSEAIKQAMDEAKSSGINPKLVDNLKGIIESEYDKIKSRDRGDSNKKEPVVTTTDKEIMKDKLKAMDAALKEAVAKAKQDKKDDKEMRQLVRNWVKEYLKTSGISAKISPVQMRAIVSRATGVVSDMTDAKMKALTDYVEKVVANQEYAQMINDLEKNKKGASKKRHNQYTEAVRKYLSLPLVNSDGTPLMNDQELKAYAESVARLNQGVPDHSTMDMNLANRVLDDYNEIPSKLEKSDYNNAVVDIKNSTISDLTEYNEFVKKVNKAKRILDSLYNNGKVTEDEYNDALNDLYTKENGLRVYEQQHQEQILDLKVNMLYDIIDMYDYIDKSGLIGQQPDLLRRYEIMLTKPEMLTTLDVKDLVKLSEVMSRMADGFVAEKELREILNKAETRGQKKGESIVRQLSTIYKSLNSPDLTKLRNLLKITEAAQIERVLGLSSGPIYNNIIQPINSAFTKMRKNTERLMDDYYKARQESKFKGDVVVKRSEYDKGLGPKISDKITVKADKYYSTRVAMLSSIFDYASKAMDQKADTKDFWGENLEKDDVKKAYHNDGSLHIVNDIYSKLNNDPRFQTNGKLDYTKIYEAFLNDPKSVMSEAEYKLYEATQRINKKEIGEALVSANAIRGINGEISAVHYPRKSLGKSSSQDADLVAGTGGKVGGLRAGSSYARVLETPTDAIDLNLDRVMATQIYEASRDLYLNDAIQQTNEVFRNAKENANPDEKALLQAIQDWNRKRVDFELEKSAKNVITRAFTGFASYALIGKVRTPAEFVTNLFAGVFNQISNVAKIGPKALISPVNPIQAREALKLMEKFDSPVQFMGWTMKSYAKYGDGKVDKDNLSSFYNNAVNMLMNISGPLTAGEWKADFDAKFKELTGENYNESKHLENDEYFYDMQQASSYANQQIERIKGGAFKGQGKQFVAVNPITDIKKIFPGVKIKDEEGMVSSNDTFAQMTNMFNNFVSRDVKNFVTGAKQAGSGRDISGGFKDMLGSTWRLGSYYVIYNLMDAAMKSAFGDDEEKKKGDKKMEMFTTEEGRWDTAFNTTLNLVTTVATSRYGANGKAIAIAALNTLYNTATTQEQRDLATNALSSMYFQEPVDVTKYGAAEKLLYIATTAYIPPADVIVNQVQREFDRLAGSDKYKGATITDFFDQAGKFFNDPEAVDFRKFMAGSLTLATQIALVSGKNIPFLKDIVKFIKKDVEDKQNIIILNAEGENLVEGVLDFDIEGNGQLTVTVDLPGVSPEDKKAINESISNVATANYVKTINEKISEIKSSGDDAMKWALIKYYAEKAKYDAKVAAKIKNVGDEPKVPGSATKAVERTTESEKMYKDYVEAKAMGKFKSTSQNVNTKEVNEKLKSMIEGSEYKDAYNKLDPNKFEDISAITAVNEYFLELYKYNTSPNMSVKPYPANYFYISNGKIIPVQ